MASTATLTETPSVLRALRELRGLATVGDVVARTGLAQADAEAELKDLLGSLKGHLEVGETGTLVYRFDPDLIRRDAEPFWSRFRRSAWRLFVKAFKVWIVVMLLVYVALFVALLLAAIFGGRDDNRIGGGRRGGRRHGGGLTDMLFWYWLWSPGWRNRPYYGHRFPSEGRRPEDRVPFYKKVFAFVFGPDEPHPTEAQKDRSTLRLIRSRAGVLTAAELMQHTGLERPEAEEELGRLMSAYDGDVRVSDRGEILYVFPDLMVSAHGDVRVRPPDPAWRRLETPRSLTGNERGTDVLIGGLNAFNLVAAATAPLFIFPRLGLGGPGAWVGLVVVPFTFSLLFFSVPLARLWSVGRENARRVARNVRKVVMGFVYRASLADEGALPVRADELGRDVSTALRKAPPAPGTVEAALHRLAAEFDADVGGDDAEALTFRFPEVRRQFEAAEMARRELALDRRGVGEIVYSSADTDAEAYERERRTFERELASGGPGGAPPPGEDLSRMIESPERVGYVEDWETVAFEEQMRARRERETVPRR